LADLVIEAGGSIIATAFNRAVGRFAGLDFDHLRAGDHRAVDIRPQFDAVMHRNDIVWQFAGSLGGS
jgi:hypothetical protein